MSLTQEWQRSGLGNAWIVYGLLATVFFLQTEQAQAQQSQRIRALPIEYRAHLPIIQVEINGKGPFDVIVDTGADITVLDAALVAELQLPVEGKQQVGSPMAEEPSYLDEVRMQSLRIGDALFEDVLGVSMDLKAMFRGIEAPHAVLSAAAFKGWLMTIDFPAESVYMRQGTLPASDGKQILDYSAEANVPRLPIVVGGLEILAVLDTGAPSFLSLPGEYKETLPLQSAPKVMGTGRTVDATFEILRANLNGELEIGKERYENPQLTFNDRSPIPVLGMKVLSEYRLTIDSTNHRIEMVRGASAMQPAPEMRRVASPSGQKRYGIMIAGIDGEAIEVTGVEEGLVADEAGVKSGDVIVGLNGEAVASLNSEQRMTHLRSSPLLLKLERNGGVIEIALSRE